MYAPGAGYPELAEIRAWIKAPATVLPDPELELMAGAEQLAQHHLLVWSQTWPPSDLPDDLEAAFNRRVARHAAAKGIPLGVLGADAEFGTVRLSRWDAEIEQLKAPYLIHAIA